jgi:cytochrome c554/c'-like protein
VNTHARVLLGCLIALLTLLGYAAHPQTPAGENKHLGVASCASSVCHGKSKAQAGQNVGLNEYRIWMDQDLHAQAYRALESPKAKQIALKLNLPSAATAKICLDCHTDNVAAAKQGPKYHITDGVACEACHGGSEKWIETHAQKDATHAANLQRGMYPSEQPLKRAELCLSCHLGTQDKFATHVIMGAGHPRLRFELEVFTVLQPAHFQVDADYVKRKGKIEGMNLWLTGQLENAERFVTLLQSPLLTPGGMIPELSFYDCFSCHHSKEKTRWSQNRAGPGIKPGTLRLQKHSFVILQAVAEALGSATTAADLKNGADELVRAGQSDPATLRAACKAMLEHLHTIEPWTKHAYSPAEVAAVRKTLLRYAAQDRASDFGTAEQIEMGVESLSYSLGDHDRRKAPLEALFVAVNNDSEFNAAQFAEIAKRAQEQF